MNEELRRRYVRDLIADLDQVGGPRLEQWIKPLWDHLVGGLVNARGLNPQGAPVPGALDATWPDGSVSEASSQADYFERPYKKPVHDFRHVIEEAPAVRTIRLFSTQVAGPKASTFAERVKSRLARRGYHLDLWDGRRIAEYIVDRLLMDERFVARVGDALPNCAASANRMPPVRASPSSIHSMADVMSKRRISWRACKAKSVSSSSDLAGSAKPSLRARSPTDCVTNLN